MNKNIQFTPRFFLNFLVLSLFFFNSLLFCFRYFDNEWWLGDYIAYSDVDDATHFKAYLSFVLWLFLFYFLVANITSRVVFHQFKSLRFMFYLVLLFFIIQIVFAYFFKVGVASSVGSVDSPVFYVVMLFSFDSFFVVYSLIEKNKKRLLFASGLFVISNVFRGWAGFVLVLGVIYICRKRIFSYIEMIRLFALFLMIVPVLLHLRSIFRPSGYSYLQQLSGAGIDGLNLNYEYFIYVLKAILTRLDFYSNYIGIERMHFSNFDFTEMCIPVTENVFSKILIKLGLMSECTALGSLLPSFLYDFFIGKGTSFSVASGFFSLPFYLFLPYFLSYFTVLLLTVLFFRFTNSNASLSIYLIYLLFFLLFQGWMYQFVYNILGLMLGLFVSRLKIT